MFTTLCCSYLCCSSNVYEQGPHHLCSWSIRMNLILIFSSLWEKQNKKTDRKLNCSFNECVTGREPHCHCCTSPQLIALCVGVWPLYSTLDKTSVSVHDACYNTQSNKVRWVCLFASCLSCSILCHIYFTEALIDLQTFRFSLRSSDQDVRGAILFYVMHLAAH